MLLTLLERRSRWVTGAAGLLALLWYSVTRLALDTLRATDLPVSDARYAGLTLAQYFAIAGVVVMTVAFWQISRAPQTGKTGGARESS
jgi:prolipoprotein diacylglyceryltransferase